MPKDQIMMGAAVAAVSLTGLWHGRWLLLETPKGQFLVRQFGFEAALSLVRVLLAAAVVFGCALASGIVNPISWDTSTGSRLSPARSGGHFAAGDSCSDRNALRDHKRRGLTPSFG